MKCWGLFVVTTATVLFTGCVLHSAGWFSHKAHASGPALRTAPREALSTAAAQRHARCQPHHWRDCLLAR